MLVLFLIAATFYGLLLDVVAIRSVNIETGSHEARQLR
jgi:hypothetical protein